jgi:hypothetical protein
MNTKCTVTDGSIYISIISITKERIQKRQEPSFDCIILLAKLSREEIDTLSTCDAQIYTQE